MPEPQNQSPVCPLPAPRMDAAAVIRASAEDALSSALVVWFLGGVALSIAGGFAGNMIPTPPPGFRGPGALHSDSSHFLHGWWHTVRGNTFVLFFVLFFAHSLWVGFHGSEVGLGRRTRRALATVREHWFSIIVGNAIGAWVAVLVLGIMQNFSLTRLLWQWVCGSVLDGVRGTGAAHFPRLEEWWNWFGNNQAKLTFWGLYLAGMCDDLGLPNIKTLGRWAWRRYQKRKLERSGAS